ncbi:MAG TPA: hypothetical protein VK743_22670, partial [Steroidobacteraceae bacterium]|nr:hypothetical protein [Steroidobacteraceae bacterium]
TTTGGQVRAVPDMLLVPLYHKVRISWDWVLVAITELDEFLTQLSGVLPAQKLDALEWDVYLSTVNEVKKDLLDLGILSPTLKFAAVTRPMPRFIWRATALRGDQPIVDILFDATDIDTGDVLVQALIHDDSACKLLTEIAAAADFEKSPIKKGVKNILRWVKENS